MAQTIIRLPITNHLTGSDYTVTVQAGSASVPLNLMVDTGSSALAVGRHAYDPAADRNARTTKLLQVAHYLSGTFTGGVIKTSIDLSDSNAKSPVSLPGVNLAVTYDTRPDIFGSADGILGLAYEVLDNAYLMPADSWANQYGSDQIGLGKECDLDPYFDQLADAGLIDRKFAFFTKRSLTSARQLDLAGDPLNAGIFVLGGGAECNDLYAGPFATAAVLHEQHYNMNLQSVQVGEQPAIPASPPAPGSTAVSNAIIDSGTCYLLFDQDLYDKIIAAFGAIDPAFADALQQNAYGNGVSCDQSTITIDTWPQLKIGFQGSGGNTAVVTISPQDYWQFDAAGPGQAVAVLSGDNGMMGGQSVLGLPIFSNHYVVFDRTASSGHGTVAFARQP